MFCHTEWYRDLIAKHRGPANKSPIILWPYPIDPWPDGPLPDTGAPRPPGQTSGTVDIAEKKDGVPEKPEGASPEKKQTPSPPPAEQAEKNVDPSPPAPSQGK